MTHDLLGGTSCPPVSKVHYVTDQAPFPHAGNSQHDRAGNPSLTTMSGDYYVILESQTSAQGHKHAVLLYKAICSLIRAVLSVI